ncbi:MAG TPA: SRPBCC family protein [Rhizomicrobium sp.]|nr:SRPBCC family protein [Rhizomicrobium sp.]
MTQANDKQQTSETVPLRISRIFHAPREVVFRAWSTADHIKRWFAPLDCTVPEASVDMRPGGTFEARMCGPDGIDHWSRGKFVEVIPHDRLVLDLHVSDGNGRGLFRAYTEVEFADVIGGTRMDITQTYTFASPAETAWAVALAPQGWSQTLDKLEAELTRTWNMSEIKHSAVHAVFTIERTYDSPPEHVFRAFSDATAKSRWFSGEEGRWQSLEREMDFRVGGRERLKGRWEGGVASTFDAIYHDIIPGERIVYAYEMHLGDRKISVSLATIELQALASRRTQLKVTEQGVFLDGYEDSGAREIGTGFLLDRLGASLGTD